MKNIKEFSDINFKIAVIGALQLKGIYFEEAKALHKKHSNKNDWGQSIIPEVYEYYRTLEIEDDKLDQIKILKPDTGTSAYVYLINHWDGEDDLFNIDNLADLEKLKNVEEIDLEMVVDAMHGYIEDVSPLLQCPRLKAVNMECFRYAENILETTEELKAKKIKVKFNAKQLFGFIPTKADILFSKGESLQEYGATDKAIDKYYAALKIDPKHTDSMLGIASVYDETEEYEKAIENFKLYLEHKTNDYDVWIRLGDLCSGLNKKEEAYLAFKKAIDIKPKNASAYNFYGYSCIKFGDAEIAKPFLSKAIKLGLEGIGAMNMGHVYLAEGNKKDALIFYKKSLECYDDSTEFENDYDSDFPLLKQYAITAKQFKEIKKEILT